MRIEIFARNVESEGSMSQLRLNASVSRSEPIVVAGYPRPCWSATVWVVDHKIFRTALQWKFEDTTLRWAAVEKYIDELDEA